MTSKKARLDKLYEGLKLNFKSAIPNQESKCLVKFHNCTRYNVLLHWIDFDGRPIKYPTLKPKESILIDTYVSHLWFFRAFVEEDGGVQMKKVFAISRDSIDSHCNAANFNYEPIVDMNDLQPRRDPSMCPLCRYIMRTYLRKPSTSPCHHYSGEAKLSSTDLEVRHHSDYNSMGAYIYTCSEDTHQEDHSRERRDFYLVESFYNLRERCFLKMSEEFYKEELGGEEFVDLNLPTSIVRDFIQFMSAIKELNKKS